LFKITNFELNAHVCKMYLCCIFIFITAIGLRILNVLAYRSQSSSGHGCPVSRYCVSFSKRMRLR